MVGDGLSSRSAMVEVLVTTTQERICCYAVLTMSSPFAKIPDPNAVQAYKRHALERTDPGLASPRAGLSASVALAVRRTIVAEGDSWCDYPFVPDIIDCLRGEHGFRVLKHAQAGDTLENMVRGTRFSPMNDYRPLPCGIDAVIADLRRTGARALVFSGGGNDIAGDEFGQFLEHAESGLPRFRRDHADHLINTVFKGCFVRLIELAESASPGVRIFTHGYGYPHPDGRGIGVAIGLSFIGPWLRPALAARRIPAMTEGKGIVAELIDMFNDMLISVSRKHKRFHHVDLRGIIGSGLDAWGNELHVRGDVYKKIARAFVEKMDAVGTWEGLSDEEEPGDSDGWLGLSRPAARSPSRKKARRGTRSERGGRGARGTRAATTRRRSR